MARWNLLVVALLVGAVAVLQFMPSRTAPAVQAEVRAVDVSRLAALEQRVADLARELDFLARAPRMATEAPVRAAVEPARDAAPDVPVGAPTAHWYLEQWLASYRQGGGGAELFRLGVQAYLPMLVDEVTALLVAHDTDGALRRDIARLLGDARLRGDSRVVDALVGALEGGDALALLDVVCASLERVGDARAARIVEDRVWRLGPHEVQLRVLALVAQLSDPERNSALERLFRSAPNEALRGYLISLMDRNDVEDALPLFQLVTVEAVDVRLAGAEAIGQFHGERVVAFIDDWRAFETDDAVRRALESARVSAVAGRSWGPEQATGSPDSGPGDDGRAWACVEPRMGVQWLELGYAQPLRCSQVRIHQTDQPGELTAVLVYDDHGTETALWSGIDPTTAPGVFELPVATTSFGVRRLRLVFDTHRRSGWTQIDAVEVVGPDGRAYATTATASSFFGQ